MPLPKTMRGLRLSFCCSSKTTNKEVDVDVDGVERSNEGGAEIPTRAPAQRAQTRPSILSHAVSALPETAEALESAPQNPLRDEDDGKQYSGSRRPIVTLLSRHDSSKVKRVASHLAPSHDRSQLGCSTKPWQNETVAAWAENEDSSPTSVSNPNEIDWEAQLEKLERAATDLSSEVTSERLDFLNVVSTTKPPRPRHSAAAHWRTYHLLAAELEAARAEAVQLGVLEEDMESLKVAGGGT